MQSEQIFDISATDGIQLYCSDLLIFNQFFKLFCSVQILEQKETALSLLLLCFPSENQIPFRNRRVSSSHDRWV